MHPLIQVDVEYRTATAEHTHKLLQEMDVEYRASTPELSCETHTHTHTHTLLQEMDVEYRASTPELSFWCVFSSRNIIYRAYTR